MLNIKSAAVAVIFATAAISSVSAHAMRSVVPANSSRYYSYQADPGEIFTASVSGSGNTDLDLYVEKNGIGTICESDSFSDDEECRVRSSNGGRYTIEVRNLGSVANVFWVGIE